MFRPINDDHAIFAVHFVLEFERPWLREDKPLIDKGYDRWKEILPGIQERQHVVIGPQLQGGGVENSTAVMPPLAYTSVERDGSREWELAFEGNSLRISCGKYSRWTQVWKIAQHLFQMVGQAMGDRKIGVRTIELTYEDLFLWEGKESQYKVRNLLTDRSGIIGKQTLEHGPMWHCHQGWIQKQTKWKGERYLERVHLNGHKGVLHREEKFAIGVATTTRLGHGGEKRLFTLQTEFTELARKRREKNGGRFEWMHEKNKELLGKVLTEKMQQAISLSVKGRTGR